MRRPEQIITNLNQKPQLCLVVATIEAELEARFRGNPIEIWYDCESSLDEIEKPLRDHLRQHGWTIVIHKTALLDRNQLSIKLTVGAINSGSYNTSHKSDRIDEPQFEQQWER